MTKSFPLDQIKRAAMQAIDEGKALVTVGKSGVIALRYFPLSRHAPIVVGDGSDVLIDDETDDKE